MTQEDLTVGQFATIRALKGKQFDKEIFTALLSFKELNTFLKVFPEVQRDANGRKIHSVKRYVLSGLGESPMRFFSSLTATARGYLYYDEAKGRLAVDVNNSRLSINDGQHRLFGINEALNELRAKLRKTKENEAEYFILSEKINYLESMTIPVMIFNDISIDEEKQLFFDMNNLASRPSRSTTIRLAQTDLLSKLVREVAETNEFLQAYGVEMDKTNIRETNPNNILLTTVYECVKMVHIDLNGKKAELTETMYAPVKEKADDILTKIFEVLPKDLDAKGKYIISKGFTLRSIMAFVIRKQKEGVAEHNIYSAIGNQNWEDSHDVWGAYGGRLQTNGSISFIGQRGGYNAINLALDEQLSKF